jgi:Bacterial Ig domain
MFRNFESTSISDRGNRRSKRARSTPLRLEGLEMRYLMAAAPVAIDDSVYYTAMNTNLVVTATSNPPGLIANDIDIDGVPQLASIVTNPTSGSLIAFASNGTFTYRPNPGFKGVDTFSYRISDGTQNSNVAIASVAVGTPLLGRANRDSNVVASIPIENTGMGSGEAIVDYTTGDLIFAESVTPSDTLVYRSDALTRPIISVVTRVSPVGPLPTAISARLTFNGIAGTVYDYNTSFLAAGQDVRFTLQADGSNLPTGMYDYSMLIATTVSGVTTNQFFAGKQAIVNRNSSEFGAGWWLEGLDRIFDSPTGALLVRGNGNTFWFRKSGTSYLHADGDVEFNTLVKSGSVFVLTSKTGIVSNFSGIGLLTSVVDTNGNTFTYTYADRNSDGITIGSRIWSHYESCLQ